MLKLEIKVAEAWPKVGKTFLTVVKYGIRNTHHSELEEKLPGGDRGDSLLGLAGGLHSVVLPPVAPGGGPDVVRQPGEAGRVEQPDGEILQGGHDDSKAEVAPHQSGDVLEESREVDNQNDEGKHLRCFFELFTDAALLLCCGTINVFLTASVSAAIKLSSGRRDF